MLVLNNSQSCNLEQCFGDLIAMEGTNANGAMPNRQHTSATPSPRATYTPTFQNKGQIWKTMVSQLELPQFPQEEGGQVQCFGDLIPMEGTHAKWCHAKSAAYVRDAKPEGDVHSNLPKQRSPLENNGFLSIKFSLSGGSKYKVLETRLRWRGRMRLEPCQIGSIRPRRQALGRRTLPLPRPWSHLGNTMVSQLEFMSNWMDLGICLRWRGRVRLEPCQIGSTRPRRQARGRRSLHPFKSIRFDMFHSLTNI